MVVRKLTEHFKAISRNENLSKLQELKSESPKRKLKSQATRENLESPSKKLKFENTHYSLFKNISGDMSSAQSDEGPLTTKVKTTARD